MNSSLSIVYQRHINAVAQAVETVSGHLRQRKIINEQIALEDLQAEDLLGMETVLFVLHDDPSKTKDQIADFMKGLTNLYDPLNHLTFSILCLTTSHITKPSGFNAEIEDQLLSRHASAGVGQYLINLENTNEFDSWLHLFLSQCVPSMCQIARESRRLCLTP
ncbi:MAG: hypothetical protein AAGA58_16470 [Verrucomicrobiota bacterium]